MVETLGEQLEFVQKQLKKALMASSRDISNRKVIQNVEQLREEKQYLLDEIDKHGKNYIPGSSSTPKKVNRKANVVIGY